MRVATTIGVILTALFVGTASAAVLDAAAAFNAPNNPNANALFSYGVGATPDTFAPLTRTRLNPVGTPTFELDNGLEQPTLSIVTWNGTGETITYLTIVQPPGVVRMDPQESAGTIVRFTAPATTTYSVAGSFEGIDTRFPGTDVKIFAGGTLRWSATPAEVVVGAPFSLTVALAAGQTIDFVVSKPPPFRFVFLSTGLQARITYLGVPAPAASHASLAAIVLLLVAGGVARLARSA